MNKLGTVLGGLLLIGAFAAPVTFGHYDTGADSAVVGYGIPQWNYTFDEDPCDPVTDTICPDRDRVSGWYYASTNVNFDANGPPISNPLSNLHLCSPDDPLTPVNESGACMLATSDISPDSLDFDTWYGLYDLEVTGAGACYDPSDNPSKSADEEAIEDALTATAFNNEVRIDGRPGLGGKPDGRYNDGGYGAVGHTFGQYECNGGLDDSSSWEENGCDQYNQAFAQDLIEGGHIWIGAQCNWGFTVLTQFVDDVINCPLGGFSISCQKAIQYADDCMGIDLITQTLADKDRSCGQGNSPFTIVCGAGDVSTIDFGLGGGTVSAGTDASYPDAGEVPVVSCDHVATATAFPFTQVVMTVNGAQSSWDVFRPATVGWVA